MRQTEPAICLKVTDYSETSQIVVFLSRNNGVIRLLARGAKRSKSKAGGAVDIFSHGNLLYSMKNLDTLGTLIEFHETVSHTALRKDACRLNIALYALELAGTVVPEADGHPEIFDLLDKVLRRMGQPDAPVKSVLAYYQKRILAHTGLMAEFGRCVSCGDSARKGFSGSLGGMLCTQCFSRQTDGIPVDVNTLEAIGLIGAAEAGRKVSMTESQAEAAIRLMDHHLCYQLSRPLKMARYVIGCSFFQSK